MLKRSRSYSCALLLSLLATACERAPEQNGASAVQPQAANMPSGSMPLASVPPAPAAPSAREALPEPIAEVAQPEPVSPAGPRVMTSHSRAQRAGVAPMPARAAEMDFAIGSGAVDGAGAPAAKSAMARRAVSPRDDAPAGEGFNTEAYAASEETPFLSAKDSPLSTFSIDVDSASYSNVRRFLAERQLPPSGAVRVEELINYFPYPYPEPSGNTPFSLNTEISTAPWDSSHELLLVGLQAKRIASSALPPRNLVFLIDVSGSMFEPNKLPLVKRSLATLVDTLTERDQIAMVVYAGNSGLVLPPTSGDRHA
ncbi:MAG TPA: von Willebrand factor type A domain-containing protein, partial [Polyangiaceae bacterium]|nr:von Willebrand factor type A domain-containing protein [Polyangiaceae bacterium]